MQTVPPGVIFDVSEHLGRIARFNTAYVTHLSEHARN